ncbi:MAG: hypothetical protein VX619_01965 [bacterium]|nr:hypothetical protein [bacterium]
MSSFETLSHQFKRIAKVKLWNHISGIFLVGIKIEEERDIFWCSLLNNPDESYGIAMYRGAVGLESFKLLIQNQSDEYEPEVATNLDAISITLEKKADLSDTYNKLLDSNACLHYDEDFYIIPASTRIGTPVCLTDDQEVNIATRVLERFADFMQPLTNTGLQLHGTEYILLSNDEALFSQWQSYRVKLNDYELDHKALLDLPIDPGYKTSLADLEIQGTIWEVHECYSPMVITDHSSGPYHPRMLLVINKEQGQILAHEIFEFGQYSQNVFLATIIEGFEFSKYIPCEIEVKSKSAHLLLNDLLSDFGVDVNLVESLPNSEN